MVTGTFVVAILGLGLLIFVHELGHFVAGKLIGLKITEFFLGLPIGRSLLKFKRGETTYGIKPVLFGGYVKFPEFMELHNTEIDKVSPTSPAQEAGLVSEDKILEIDGKPVKNWLQIFEIIKKSGGKSAEFKIKRNDAEEVLSVDIGARDGVGWLGAGPSASDDITIDDLPDTLTGQGFIKKGLVMVAGPMMNVLLALVLIIGVLLVGFAEPTTTIGKVLKGGPAEKVGIKSGDTIVAIGGKATPSWQKVVTETHDNAGSDTRVVVKRADKRITFDAKLREKNKDGILGVATKLERRPRGLIAATKEGFSFTYRATGIILDLIGKLITAPKSVLGQLRSPIGAVTETAPIVQRDIMEYIITLAGISIAIGIFNLLPMPPLDGGRILISGIESLIRRPMPKEALIFINVIGVSLLLMLMTYVIAADIFRIVTPGSG